MFWKTSGEAVTSKKSLQSIYNFQTLSVDDNVSKDTSVQTEIGKMYECHCVNGAKVSHKILV